MSDPVVVGTDEVSPVLGVLDVLVRAFKTGVEVFLVGLPVDGIFSMDVGALKMLALAAGGAAGSIILNAILSWARTRNE